MKKLIDDLRNNKPTRKQWRIKPKIEFGVDRRNYLCVIVPTIITQPWPYRSPGQTVVEIMWLNFHIGFGEWTNKKSK